MSDGRSGKRRTVLITAVLVVVTAVAAFPAARALHNRRLHGLFSGPFEEQAEDRSGFYPGLEYDLKAYLPEPSGVATKGDEEKRPGILERREDEDAWARAIEESHKDYKLDASSGSTRVNRLKTPSVYRAPWVPRVLTLTYPCDNALFPPNLCAPFVEWSDVNNDLWQVTVSAPDASLEWTFLSAERRWRIPDDVWTRIREAGSASLRVTGIQRSGLWGKARASVHRSRAVTIRISKDPADNAIIYRLVRPPFITKKTPNMYVRDIRRKRDRVFLGARQQYCLNCHTFSSKSGTHGKVGFQIRYIGAARMAHPIYFAVYDIDRQEGRKIILPFAIQMTTFMAWSPDETKLAFSANQALATLPPIVYETQFAGQSTSDLAVYDATAGSACLVKGAADPKVLEIYPYWTPDGRSIVYSSAPAGLHPTVTRFDLMVIPYDGGRGGTPVPIRGAAANGRSNHYARFSPDGRWMTFVQSAYGSLIKASSDVWIMPATLDAPPRRLASNVPYAADSWHSWSSNSRWIVFATKRDDGIYARVYMTHIDDEGNASPAVRLPIETPEMRTSFNLPEFVAEVPPVGERQLFNGVGEPAAVLNVKPFGGEADEAGPR
ncbi:MAG TPA: hypothetical protein VMZ92_12965 [Planctomycetota bacterium]|nr:hypothetical protein [Planctomycetota bacterium]